jgi:ArsR family transcriptional regulator, arsenate/arsenite/antimonite-responsive transcriptional repressor
MDTESILIKMESLFTALADKTRLRLLNLMRDDEVCVCFFTEVLEESQPKISRHLAYLRNAGIVCARRDGKWMHYRIEMPDDPLIASILRNTLEALRQKDVMIADYENLINACCAIEVPTTIARAPKPETLLETNMFDENQPRQQLETYLL